MCFINILREKLLPKIGSEYIIILLEFILSFVINWQIKQINMRIPGYIIQFKFHCMKIDPIIVNPLDILENKTRK